MTEMCGNIVPIFLEQTKINIENEYEYKWPIIICKAAWCYKW